MELEKYKQFSLIAFSIINKLWSYRKSHVLQLIVKIQMFFLNIVCLMSSGKYYLHKQLLDELQ